MDARGDFGRRCCLSCNSTSTKQKSGFFYRQAYTFLLILFVVVETMYIALLKLDSLNIEFGTVTGLKKTLTYGIFHCDTLQGNVEFKDQMGRMLQELYHSIDNVKKWDNATKLTLLEKFVKISMFLSAKTFPVLKQSDLRAMSNANKIVCPELYMGTLHDYPEHLHNWEVVNCSYAVPVDKLITFVLVVTTHNRKELRESAQLVLKSIQDKFENVQIVVSTDDILLYSHIKSSGLTYTQRHDKKTIIQAWNKLIRNVETPYVFVARKFHQLDMYSLISRPLSMLSSVSGVAAVLFASRGPNSLWAMDCFQVKMVNYELALMRGYHQSFNESLVCHHGNGPFLAKTNILQNMRLDKALLDESLAFLDLFLRLKAENYLVVNMPDYMTITLHKDSMPRRERWIPFVKKWQLNTVKVGSELMKFDCAESEMICRSRGYTNYGFMVPTCCLRSKSRMLNDVLAYCSKLKIPCELDSGSIMSAVKFQRQISWDLDEDVCMLKDNRTSFMNHMTELERLGPYIVKPDRGGFTVVFKEKRLRKLKIDIFHMSPHITVGNVHTGSYSPTKIRYHGFDANVPYNPGLFLRNRYGPEYLQHAPSWVSTGLDNSFKLVPSGRFIRCALPGHHACLDQFVADGNLEFGDI